MMSNMLATFFRPARFIQSYTNLLYMLFAFLLSSGYLVFLTIGIALSLATLPIFDRYSIRSVDTPCPAETGSL